MSEMYSFAWYDERRAGMGYDAVEELTTLVRDFDAQGEYMDLVNFAAARGVSLNELLSLAVRAIVDTAARLELRQG